MNLRSGESYKPTIKITKIILHHPRPRPPHAPPVRGPPEQNALFSQSSTILNGPRLERGVGEPEKPVPDPARMRRATTSIVAKFDMAVKRKADTIWQCTVAQMPQRTICARACGSAAAPKMSKEN